MIGLLALHTSELGENVPVSEVIFVVFFIFFSQQGVFNAFTTYVRSFHNFFCFEPCFIFNSMYKSVIWSINEMYELMSLFHVVVVWTFTNLWLPMIKPAFSLFFIKSSSHCRTFCAWKKKEETVDTFDYPEM